MPQRLHTSSFEQVPIKQAFPLVPKSFDREIEALKSQPQLKYIEIDKLAVMVT
jgi:hypothetical protein